VDSAGLVSLSPDSLRSDDIYYLQATNGETGVVADLDPWRKTDATVIVDGTKSLPQRGLTDGFAVTVLEATSWSGPSGIGFININAAEDFTYPLPHIAPIRTPGSYSLPLLIGAAVALSENQNISKSYRLLRSQLAHELSALDGVTVIAPTEYESRYISIVVTDYAAEEILTELLKNDSAIDAGSACSPEDLAPSHVIKAMGYPTPGHLRFTLHPEHSSKDVKKIAEKLKKVLSELGR
jgi:cysteine desulfurase